MSYKIDTMKFMNPKEFPEYQTKERCIYAVSIYSSMLTFVEDQTEDICIAAVGQNPIAMTYIKNQTPELCLKILEKHWRNVVYKYIKIPVEGEFLKEINRMKLIKGPME